MSDRSEPWNRAAQLRNEGALPTPWQPHGPNDPASGPGLARLAAYQLDAVVELAAYSVRRSRAAGVRAAMRPGMAATRLPSTRAPTAMAPITSAGTVGLGTT
jgi:hypothetical protein